MAYSDEYLRQLDKKAAGRDAVPVETVKDLFRGFVSELPEVLCRDIFSLFFDGDEPDVKVPAVRAERLSLVIDLLEGDYPEDDPSLTDAELNYISEGINDFALELPDELIMNVMKTAVARGLMG
jgi:hypothetical protein